MWTISLKTDTHVHIPWLYKVQFSSVAQSCLTLCSPVDCRMPGLPVHHQLPEFTQTHVNRVSDAIQPSHPLSSPSPTSIFPSIRVFFHELALCITWPDSWSFSYSISPYNKYSGLVSFRIKKIKGNWLVWSPYSPRDSLESSLNTTVQKHQLFGTQPSFWSNSHIHTRLLEKP